MSESVSLAQVARAGFTDLEAGRASVERVATLAGITVEDALLIFASSADPSRAGTEFARLYDLDTSSVTSLARDPEALRRLVLVLGGSRGLAEFLQRHPASLRVLRKPLSALPTQEEARKALCAAVDAKEGFAAVTGDIGKEALRVRYRELLVAVAAYDLGSAEPVVVVDAVAAALADLAGGAIEASLAVARADLVGDFTREEIDLVELSVISTI
mgnify:CR=1 FL=1